MARPGSSNVITPVGRAAAGAVPWRFRGQLNLTTIVKATFSFRAGEAASPVDPEPLTSTEIHHGGIPSRSVQRTSDLAPWLARTDVLFVGHAYAPPGFAVQALRVRLTLLRDEQALLSKALDVRGISRPFQRMPLTYEMAYGGNGSKDNPFGTGIVPGDKRPAVVDPADPTKVAGFAPISAIWPVRRRLRGRVERKALERPLVELPDDFDFGYYQAAPPDQQIGALDGTEWLILEGLHPALPVVRTRLPGARAFARIIGEPDLPPMELRADTLWIDGDTQTVSIVWRGHVAVPSEDLLATLRIAAGVEMPDAPIEWPDPSSIGLAEQPLSEEPAPAPAPDFSRTVPLEAPAAPVDRAVALPFLATPPSSESPRATLDLATTLHHAAPAGGTLALSPAESSAAATKPLVPFGGVPNKDVAPPPSRRRSAKKTPGVDITATIIEGRSGPVLPFSGAPAAPAPGGAPRAPLPGAPWSNEPARAVPQGSAATTTVSLGDGLPEPARAAESQAAESQGAESQGAESQPRDRAPSYRLPPRREAIPVVTTTPLLAFTLAWQMEPPEDVRVVVVKGTFDLVPQRPAALRAETDMISGDVHASEDPRSSLLHPSDFALFKPRADVTLKGHVHAPGGSSPAAQATFRFGHPGNRFERRIAAFGHRIWQKTVIKVAPSEPRPFDKIALVHENAFGGPGIDANPVGMGAAGDERDGSARLPLLEIAEELVQSPSDRPSPACFGAIPPLWKQRSSMLGTYDARWLETRWPYFPEDFRWESAQAAPRSQQLDHLLGDEPFQIIGMDPEHPKLSGRLPGVRVECFARHTEQAGGGLHPIVMRLDTVSFDVDERKVNLVWRGLFKVRDEEASEVAAIFVSMSDLREPQAKMDEVRRAFETASAPLLLEEEGPEPRSDLEVAEVIRSAGVPELEETGSLRDSVLARVASGASFEGADLARADLSDLDFAGRSFAHANLKGARLARARFSGADLRGAQMSRADLTDVVLDGANLDGADLFGANLDGASFAGASLNGTDLSEATGPGAIFRGARGEGASFAGGAWTRASFEGATLTAAEFTRAVVDEARFTKAVLGEVRFYDARGKRAIFHQAVMAGARADGARFERCSFERVSAASSVWDEGLLDGSTFVGADLQGASFCAASCRSTSFSAARIREGRFRRAKLPKATFLKADLMQSTFEAADLTGADLRGSNLHGSEMWRATLRGAKLDLALVTETKLEDQR